MCKCPFPLPTFLIYYGKKIIFCLLSFCLFNFLEKIFFFLILFEIIPLNLGFLALYHACLVKYNIVPLTCRFSVLCVPGTQCPSRSLGAADAHPPLTRGGGRQKPNMHRVSVLDYVICRRAQVNYFNCLINNRLKHPS